MKKGSSKSRHHMGYPPVTPNALATDTILSQIFDQLWGEVCFVSDLLFHFQAIFTICVFITLAIK